MCSLLFLARLLVIIFNRTKHFTYFILFAFAPCPIPPFYDLVAPLPPKRNLGISKSIYSFPLSIRRF